MAIDTAVSSNGAVNQKVCCPPLVHNICKPLSSSSTSGIGRDIALLAESHREEFIGRRTSPKVVVDYVVDSIFRMSLKMSSGFVCGA